MNVVRFTEKVVVERGWEEALLLVDSCRDLTLGEEQVGFRPNGGVACRGLFGEDSAPRIPCAENVFSCCLRSSGERGQFSDLVRSASFAKDAQAATVLRRLDARWGCKASASA